MGQTECRGNQCDHRVLVVEVQAEGTAGGPHRWKCRGRQTDYRICGLLRLSCYWAHSGRPGPEPDTAETWLQPCEPGKQGQRVMDRLLGKRSCAGLVPNQDAQPAPH